MKRLMIDGTAAVVQCRWQLRFGSQKPLRSPAHGCARRVQWEIVIGLVLSVGKPFAFWNQAVHRRCAEPAHTTCGAAGFQTGAVAGVAVGRVAVCAASSADATLHRCVRGCE
eukprot:6204227-Pleurochrysis_carterae.AAC.3